MSDETTYDRLELVGYRVPDFSVDRLGDGTTERIELPGIYRVGVLIDGQFVEVTAFKAGLLQNSAAAAAQGRERDRQQAAAEQQLREQEAAEQEQGSTAEPTTPPSG